MKTSVLGIALAVLLCSPVFAETYSELSTVKSITVADDLVRVRLATMVNIEGCSSNNWYAVDLNETYAKEKYSSLLAAKTTQEKVFLQFLQDACHGGYPKINAASITKRNTL